MNQEVIIKALKKAQSKGLTPEDTADLIQDYLEIAGEVAPADLVFNSPAPPPPFNTSGHIQVMDQSTPETGLIAPAKVGKIIGVSSGDSNFWTVDSLMKALENETWAFSALPQGWSEPLEYKGMLTPNPRGMDGVGVVFRCPRVDTPSEFPAFFPLSEKAINPQAVIQEVKSQVEQLFRVRTEPIGNSTKLRTSAPSMQEIMGQGGGMFGGDV